MDVTFVCAGEESFKMEVGFFDTVHDIKQKLQSRRGWPAAAVSLFHNGDALADAGGEAGGAERYGIMEGSVIHVELSVAVDVAGRQQQHEHKGRSKRRDDGHGGGGSAPALRVNVVSRCGRGRAEVAVGARRAVAALRRELEERAFPLPRDGAYFFIHRQSVMDESRSFEWHGVAAGDEVVVFEGSVTRPPAY
uniref:Ubiquitin-like domain-containing protein n=1 Tax=Oryza punctata TaxID=4537 RepID=A0A0E0M2L2_ORYPU